MRILLITLLSVGIGLLGGTGAAVWQLGWWGNESRLDASALEPESEPEFSSGEETGTPKVEVGLKRGEAIQRGTTSVDFSRLRTGAKDYAEFVFFNEGDATLKLMHRAEDSSCKCTIAQLSPEALAPGESAQAAVAPREHVVVRLGWDTAGLNGEFRHHALIRTNDPNQRRVRLEVTGFVVPGLTFEPRGIRLGEVHQDERRSMSFHAVAYDREDLRIASCTVVDPELARHFELTHEKLAASELFDGNAVCGYRITATLKPGLRLGSFETRIRVTTNGPQASTKDAGLAVTIVGDIAVAPSSGWLPHLRVFNLGRIDQRSGGGKTLYLLVRGPQKEDIQIKVAKTSPAALKASVGKPLKLKRLVRWPVRIEVPKGTPVMTHQESGKFGQVVLETTHPDEKEKAIDVSFRVR